jgi:hypothetical protein
VGKFFKAVSPDAFIAGKAKVDKIFSVFVPAAAANTPSINNVHVMFAPLKSQPGYPQGYLVEQLIEEQTNELNWVTISVPNFLESDSLENGVPLRDLDIEVCLKAAGRAAGYERVRLTSHSRGVHGLVKTIGGVIGGATLSSATLAKVDRIGNFDSPYESLGTAIRAQKKDLGGLLDASKAFRSDAVRLYSVKIPNKTGFSSIDLREDYFRGIVYLRWLKRTMNLPKEGKIGIRWSEISSEDKVTFAAVLKTSWELALDMPFAGGFTSVHTPKKRDIQKYFAAEGKRLAALSANQTNALKQFMFNYKITTSQPWGLDAHHFVPREFVAEVLE